MLNEKEVISLNFFFHLMRTCVFFFFFPFLSQSIKQEFEANNLVCSDVPFGFWHQKAFLLYLHYHLSSRFLCTRKHLDVFHSAYEELFGDL